MKRRLNSLLLTLAGLLLLVVYFQLEYVAAGQHAYGKETFLHPGSIDALIPLAPGFIIFYMLGYLLPFTLCFIVKNSNERVRLFITVFLMFSIAFLFFHFFPVKMEKILADGTDPLSKLTRVHQEQDSYFNCFPSLHVSLNVFTALLFLRSHRRHLIWVAPLMVLITLATLFVKQHLFADVLGGVVLALGGFGVYIFSAHLALRTRRLVFQGALAGIALSIVFRWKLIGRIYGVLAQIMGESISAFFGSIAAQIALGVILLVAITVSWTRSDEIRGENQR